MTKPRTVKRFIEQRVTLGQIAYEAYHRRAGIPCAWSDLDDESRAEWEAAADAVADAVEDTRDDESPVQRIEPKPATVKVDGADFVKELDALLRRASEQSGTSDIKFQPHSALIGDPALVDKLVTFGAPRPGFTVGTTTAPLPPSAFPGEPFIPSDS